MNTKLTLSINTKTVVKAKKYAKRKGISVSKIFEEHIATITNEEKTNPLESLQKLRGIAKGISGSANYKDLITDSIIEKHIK